VLGRPRDAVTVASGLALAIAGTGRWPCALVATWRTGEGTGLRLPARPAALCRTTGLGITATPQPFRGVGMTRSTGVPSSTQTTQQAPETSDGFDLDVSLIEVSDPAGLVNLTDDGCGSTCGACVTNAA
jgi:FxLD family lantipeptide